MNHLWRAAFLALLLVLTQSGQAEHTTPAGVREAPAGDVVQLESAPHPATSGAGLWLPDRSTYGVHTSAPWTPAPAPTRVHACARTDGPEHVRVRARCAAGRFQPPTRAPPAFS